MSWWLVELSLLLAFLALCFHFFYRNGETKRQVPGLRPRNKETGNLEDIVEAGSLHEFLLDLHQKFGPIASFWMHKKWVVSISTPELFRANQTFSDRPPELFKLFEPFLGRFSIQYANGDEWKSRKKLYSRAFSHGALSLYYPAFQKMADGIAVEWKESKQPVPICEHMMKFAIRSILLVGFGKYFEDSEMINDILVGYNVCWDEMKRQESGFIPDVDSQRQKDFEKNQTKIREILKNVLKDRIQNPPEENQWLFIDYLISSGACEEQILSDCITYLTGGFHTTGNLLSWCFYFLAANQNVQQRLADEIEEVIGDEDVNEDNINNLLYAWQVLNETLRGAVIAPWAARVNYENDCELGGYPVPRGTPIIHALGVSLQNEMYWPQPKRFDPDRFSPDKKLPLMSFEPFGFAGKRKCPGYRFSYAEATVCLVTLIRQFRVNLVPEQRPVTMVYGLVTHPKDEIFLMLTGRMVVT